MMLHHREGLFHIYRQSIFAGASGSSGGGGFLILGLMMVPKHMWSVILFVIVAVASTSFLSQKGQMWDIITHMGRGKRRGFLGARARSPSVIIQHLDPKRSVT